MRSVRTIVCDLFALITAATIVAGIPTNPGSRFLNIHAATLTAQQARANGVADRLIDFENLTDSTPVTNQYRDAIFERATVISAGVSLNEFEAKPHSGSNVVFDDGGPIVITLASPVAFVGGYFTYSSKITMLAFDENNQQVASATSKATSNFAVSGDVKGITNELITIGYGKGIARVLITGKKEGSSFVLDDLTTRSTERNVKVFFHDHGRSTELKDSSVNVDEVSANAEKLLRSSDLANQLSLIVKSDDIESIKRNEMSLELLYNSPTSFDVGVGGRIRTIRLDRLLISLSGRFGRIVGTEKFATIFYGVGHYGAGPFTNSGSPLEILINDLKTAVLLRQ